MGGYIFVFHTYYDVYMCVQIHMHTHRIRMCFIGSTVSDPIEGIMKCIVYVHDYLSKTPKF